MNLLKKALFKVLFAVIIFLISGMCYGMNTGKDPLSTKLNKTQQPQVSRSSFEHVQSLLSLLKTKLVTLLKNVQSLTENKQDLQEKVLVLSECQCDFHKSKNQEQEDTTLNIHVTTEKVLKNLPNIMCDLALSPAGEYKLLKKSNKINALKWEVKDVNTSTDFIFILSINRNKIHWDEIVDNVKTLKEKHPDVPIIIIKGMNLAKYRDGEDIKKNFWNRNIPEKVNVEKKVIPFDAYSAVFWFDTNKNDNIILNSADNVDEMEQLIVFMQYFISLKTEEDKQVATQFFKNKEFKDDKLLDFIKIGRKKMISKRLQKIEIDFNLQKNTGKKPRASKNPKIKSLEQGIKDL